MIEEGSPGDGFDPAAYDLVMPPKVVFGWGRRRELPQLAQSLGRRALLISGSRTLEASGRIAELIGLLEGDGITVQSVARIHREPRTEDVDAAADTLRQLAPTPQQDFLLAIGGGSALDLTKALSGLATDHQGESVRDYLEGVGRGLRLSQQPLPWLAMPTTGGTGSEATKNAVISGGSVSHPEDDPPFKKSFRDERLLAAAVLIDPELADGLPAPITAATGMDAITQLIEAYITRHPRRIPKGFCLQGLALAIPSLREAVVQPASRWARENLAHAAFLSGVALANSGLGLAHGVAAALGIQRDVPHGLACAIMLPTALRVNLLVREVELAQLAAVVTPGVDYGSTQAAAEGTIVAIEELCGELKIPQKLSEVGVLEQDIPPLVRNSHGNSFRNNPREVSDEELTDLLGAML